MAGSYSMGTVAGTDVPVEHLDYAYIGNCRDAGELEEIVKVLRQVLLVGVGTDALVTRSRPPLTCAAGLDRRAATPSCWRRRRSA